MPRKKFYPTSEFSYHVYARCWNREWFKVPLDEVWEVFENYLFFVSKAYNFQVHSFVLMNNHFHMLVSTPDANLDRAMNYFMREVSKRLGERTGRINQIFGGPYRWTVIKSEVHFSNAYKYVYRNPVDAGMCSKVEDYPFSTLQRVLGFNKFCVPLIDSQFCYTKVNSYLSWLNKEFKDQDREAIAQALKRREFGFVRDTTTARNHKLDSELG